VGRGWPSLATQAIGQSDPSFETWDRICKTFGWPQTFVGAWGRGSVRPFAGRSTGRGRGCGRRGDQVPKRLAAPLRSRRGVMGGFFGRVAWEWFATKAVGFDFGSEFEGYDWLIGFAFFGVLVGPMLGSALAVQRARRAPAR
jgi:hypothetical protein